MNIAMDERRSIVSLQKTVMITHNHVIDKSQLHYGNYNYTFD